MICVAAASKETTEARDCESLFKRWVSIVDPGGCFFASVFSLKTDWGWLGLAGTELASCDLKVDRDSLAKLFVGGMILDKEILGKLRSHDVVDASVLDEIRQARGQFIYVAYMEKGCEYFECGTDSLQLKPLYGNDLKCPSVVSNYASLCGVLAGGCELNVETAVDFVIKTPVLPNASMVSGVYHLSRGTSVRLAGERFSVEDCGFGNLATQAVTEQEACSDLLDGTKALGDYPGIPLLGLTGGRDSRLMMAALVAADIPFESATHRAPSKDSLTAAKLASRCGVKHWILARTGEETSCAVASYLATLPLCDGYYGFPMFERGPTVHSLVEVRGMIHVGGLGGEVLKSYWDPQDAMFQTPQEAVLTRFFKPACEALYQSRDQMERSKDAWLNLVENAEGVDPFVVFSIAYLDARLRGLDSACANGTLWAYAWPLANRALLCHAFQLPRAERQRGAIFERLIGIMAPHLLEAQWYDGRSGTYGDRGLRGLCHRLRRRASRFQTLHVLRGKAARLKRKLRPGRESVSTRIVSRWFSSSEGLQFSRAIISSKGIKLLESGSVSYAGIVRKLFGLYHYDLFLRCLSDSQGRIEWQSDAMAKLVKGI